MPDVIILDYLDKMHPNQKSFNLSDVWSKDKYCSEQLRDIGVDYDIAIITASQLNRAGVEAEEHNHTHIAGGISKINESDIYVSIRLTPELKVKRECIFKFEKTRNSDGVGSVITMTWDPKYLRIRDRDSIDFSNIKQKQNVKEKSTNVLTEDAEMLDDDVDYDSNDESMSNINKITEIFTNSITEDKKEN